MTTVDIRNYDPINLNPLSDGVMKISSVKMDKFSRIPQEQRKIFHFDKAFSTFHENKQSSMKESVDDHYRISDNLNISPIVDFFCRTLASETPEHFQLFEEKLVLHLKCKLTNTILSFDKLYGSLLNPKGVYKDSIDALCMQVQDDVVIHSKDCTGDSVTGAHLCAPMGWEVQSAFGKSFAAIHEDVMKSNGELVIKAPEKIVEQLIKPGVRLQRVGAYSFRDKAILNGRPGRLEKISWNFEDDNQVFLLRTERQSIVSFPKINSFLFTIRPYYVDLTSPERIGATLSTFETLDKDVYPREFAFEHRDAIIRFLKRKL